MYYYITDHIGNVRLVADASGAKVAESDYLPFGTENVITSTITNNYKFIGMERDTEGTAALDHTLFREYAPNLARWTSPDPVDGSPDNPQSWNRYPYVLNDPMTYTDPLGGRQRPRNLVGCFPTFRTLMSGDYGCGYDWGEDDRPGCPPGYTPIYGNDNGNATIASLQQYANVALPGFEQYGVSYESTPEGIHISLPPQIYAIMVANGFQGIAIPIAIGGAEIVYSLVVTSIYLLAEYADEIASAINDAIDETAKEAECAKEWEEAIRICSELLSRRDPPRGLTGGHTTVLGCAKGFVSEACGGNPIDHSYRPRPAPPRRGRP
jgi:RHS repeat-associated protein